MRKMATLCLSLIVTSASALEVSVSDLESWTELKYNGIRPNAVSVADGELLIEVRGSASPLVHKFDEAVRIKGLTVVASWNGRLELPAGATEGDKNADDFVLKFGIVESGERRLNWLQRRTAAGWVRKLFALAPEGSGIDRINFLSTTQQKELLNTSRAHALSDLLFENRILYLAEPGPFTMSHQFPEAVESLGLWISSDGDDTGSSFDLRIASITLHLDEEPDASE